MYLSELVNNLEGQAKQTEQDKQLKDIQAKGNSAYQDIEKAIGQYDKNSQKARELAKVKRDFINLLAANPDSPLLYGVNIVDDQVSGGQYDKIVDGIIKNYQQKGSDARASELANAMRDNQAAIAEEKRKYDEMGRLSDLYHKFGQTTDDQYYKEKRDQALALEQAQIAGYNRDLATLKSYHAKTADEQAKNAGQIADITGKKLAAESAYQDHLKFFNAEESLRAQKVAQDSTDAMNKYVSGLQQEAEKIEASTKVRNVANSVLQNEEAARIDAALAAAQQNLALQTLNGASAGELASSQAIIEYLTKISDLRHRIANAEGTKESNAALLAQAKKYEDAWQQANKSIADGLYEAIGRGGDSAIKKLIQDVKSWFARLVLSVPINFISNVGASIISPGAGSAQGAAGNALGLATNGYSTYNSLANLGMNAGNLLTGAGALFGSSTLSAAGYAAAVPGLTSFGVGSQAAMLAAQTAEFGTAGLSATAAAGATGAGGMAGITSVLGSIPVAGWIALAAIVAAKFGGGGDREMTGSAISGHLGTDDLTRDVSWKKDGGWFHGDSSGTWKYKLADSKTTIDSGTYTDSANIDANKAFLKTLNDAYDKLKTSNADYAKALGFNADAVKDRTDEINFALSSDNAVTQSNMLAALQGVSDKIAATLVPELSKFSLAGETASSTLARLAFNLDAVNPILQAVGVNIFDVGLKGADAAYKLAQVFGGVEAMNTAVNGYVQNIYSDSEKLALDQQNLAATFKKLGVDMPTTKEGFKDLVTQIGNLATGTSEAADGNKTLYMALMAVSGAFASVTDRAAEAAKASQDAAKAALDKANQELDTARSALSDAYNREASAIQSVIDKWSQFSASIRQFKDSLLTGNLSTLSPEQKYAETKAQFDKTYALALAGDPTAMGNLQGMAQQFLDASHAYNASNQGYVDDFNKVQTALSNAASAADRQVSIAQSQLNVLNDTVKGILDVNNSVLSVRDALIAYFNAKNGVATAGGSGGYTNAMTGTPINTGNAGFDKALAGVSEYGSKYGDDAYYFADGANHFDNLTENVARVAKLTGKSEAESWLLSTGHTAKYWQDIQDQYDAGKHPKVGSAVDGSHADGLNYVPFDGYRAELHRGERVLTAAEAIKFNNLPLISLGAGQTNSDNRELIAEVRRLNGRIGQLEERLVLVGVAQLEQGERQYIANREDMAKQTTAVKSVRNVLEAA
ncbi:MAG: hypothetical protein V4488_26200 [Pseudomonadota bacterium]